MIICLETILCMIFYDYSGNVLTFETANELLFFKNIQYSKSSDLFMIVKELNSNLKIKMVKKINSYTHAFSSTMG